LEGLQTLRFTGVIESTAVSHNQERTVPLSINVYGPLSSADQVGRVLSAASTFLQHPFFLEPGCKDYFNPQMFRTSDQMQNLTHLVGLTEQDLRAKAISDGVQDILESLDEIAPFDSPDDEVEWEPQGLLTCLTEYGFLFGVAISANTIPVIRFLRSSSSNVESHTFTVKPCTRGCGTSLIYRRLAMFPRGDRTQSVPVVISSVLTPNSPQYNIPSYSTGGILADVMGLGKTLTMVSTIVSTIIPSREYLKSGPRTGATLVVVSSVRECFPTQRGPKKTRMVHPSGSNQQAFGQRSYTFGRRK
jgi:hypothetical protein